MYYDATELEFVRALAGLAIGNHSSANLDVVHKFLQETEPRPQDAALEPEQPVPQEPSTQATDELSTATEA